MPIYTNYIKTTSENPSENCYHRDLKRGQLVLDILVAFQ